MKKTCNLKSPLSIALIVWLLFSVPFTAIMGWNYFKSFVYAKGVQDGQTNAVVTLIQEAEKCQPIPVRAGDVGISMISIECLQKAQAEAGKAEEAK